MLWRYYNLSWKTKNCAVKKHVAYTRRKVESLFDGGNMGEYGQWSLSIDEGDN